MPQKPLNRILLVEDESDIQTIANLALTAVGKFTVEICSSGKEAIEKAPSFNPDLILLDVMMPEMDGITTMESLRQIPQLVDTPIIFMTAKTQQSEIDNYKELGALDVISKPFDPITLSQTVKNIWEKHYE